MTKFRNPGEHRCRWATQILAKRRKSRIVWLRNPIDNSAPSFPPLVNFCGVNDTNLLMASLKVKISTIISGVYFARIVSVAQHLCNNPLLQFWGYTISLKVASQQARKTRGIPSMAIDKFRKRDTVKFIGHSSWHLRINKVLSVDRCAIGGPRGTFA